MAHVEDRWFRKIDGVNLPTSRNGAGDRWRARYLVDGRERSKAFARKSDAERFLKGVEADLMRGTYLDPDAGLTTLRRYVEGDGGWLAAQTFDESTREQTALRLRLHVMPQLGDRALVSIKPTDVQSWMRGLQATLAPRTVRLILAHLSTILSAAVDDELIAKNPCRAGSVRAPKIDAERVVPWTFDQVAAVRDALPDRFAVLVTLCAGLGLRQGEAFGLAVEDIDFLRGVVHVKRQVKIVGGKQVLALPKGRKVRDVPLPESVAFAIAGHLERWPAADVELPWGTSTGAPISAELLVTTRESTACQRSYMNARLWKPALRSAGLPSERSDANGMHALRHFYASMLLDAGESVRALADYLGHADPGFTLRVYTHLMPASEECTQNVADGSWPSRRAG